jgi:hypothetical protein
MEAGLLVLRYVDAMLRRTVWRSGSLFAVLPGSAGRHDLLTTAKRRSYGSYMPASGVHRM